MRFENQNWMAELKAEEHGEILFTDYGLSGIAAMNLSYIVSENFAKEKSKNVQPCLILYPEMNKEDISDYIKIRQSARNSRQKAVRYNIKAGR